MYKNKNKITYAIALSAHAIVYIKANNYDETEQIALENYDDGKFALISSIKTNGHEADYEETKWYIFITKNK